MNKKIKATASFILTVASATLLVVAVVKAGSLTPTTSPGSTMYTLNDIWQKITDNDNPSLPTEGNHAFPPSSNPAGTMHTLADIYTEIPTLDASKILTGTTYMGVPGTAPGPVTWQTEPEGGFLNLCWSAGTYEQANGCSAGNGLLDPLGNGSVLLGAFEYCRYLNQNGATLNCSGGSCTIVDYWHTPTISELLKGIADQFILSSGSGFDGSSAYWSRNASGAGRAFLAYWTGRVDYSNEDKIDLYSVRCVR